MLYYNLKHSLAETISYYISLASISGEVHLPVDIKLSLYSLNNLDDFHFTREKKDGLWYHKNGFNISKN